VATKNVVLHKAEGSHSVVQDNVRHGCSKPVVAEISLRTKCLKVSDCDSLIYSSSYLVLSNHFGYYLVLIITKKHLSKLSVTFANIAKLVIFVRNISVLVCVFVYENKHRSPEGTREEFLRYRHDIWPVCLGGCDCRQDRAPPKTLNQHVGYPHCLCIHLLIRLSRRWTLMAEYLDSSINVNISSRILRCISAKNSLVSAAYASMWRKKKSSNRHCCTSKLASSVIVHRRQQFLK